MTTLTEILLASPKREALIAGGAALLEKAIADRSGLTGMAYRTGYAMIKAAKPGAARRASNELMPGFAEALNPLFQQHLQQGGTAETFGSAMLRHADEAISGMIAVADRRVEGSSDLIRKTYARFRGNAESEVARILPDFAKLIDRVIAQPEKA
ncbi:DUF6918 family protein [Polycyclovorans algicola]|uniref:DUF6918 family protein n=1 Tax=Polycyclovorans algicola TaxID=616992 RepID=UPI0004A73EE7|nr:hypothetical protein [Polycyclovorans algicola]